MVHIKEIKMTGWKSYGPATVRMPLAKGFTCIVGPNGSGKSNSIDAVNFCLGLLSKKAMRADSMVNLLYNGIGGKKASEKAIVDIVFDNSDYAIPIREPEITVTRELKRNGTGTYRLNGKRTTRTDILDKLRIAGIDVINSYNIIAQGQVGEIVGMSPNQRRELMENLAGVGQFDEKKQASLKELDEANRRMDELQLLVNEVGKRVESLRKEKEDAERWQTLDTEIRDHRSLLVSYGYHRNNQQISALDEEIGGFRNRQEELMNERTNIETKIEEANERIRSLEDQLIRLETSVTEIRTTAEEKNIEKTKIGEKVEYNKKTISTNENRVTKLQSRLEQINKQIEEDKTRKEELEEEKKNLMKEIEETQASRAQLDMEHEKKSQEYEEIKNEHEDCERRHRVENDRLTKTQVSFEVAQSMVDAFQNNVNEFERRQGQLEEQIKAAEEKTQELKSIIADDTTRLEEARSRIGDIEEKKVSLDGLIESLDAQIRETNDNYLVQKAQIDTISSFLKTEAGKENPAVSFISDRKNNGDLPGVLGEFQNISGSDGAALPSEVGHLSDAIITDTVDHAIKCIQLLKDNAVGAANFIPLERFKLSPTDKFSNIIKKVREQNEIVPDLQAAARAWKKSGSTVTTVEGDVFYSNGIINGGFHLASAQETVETLRAEMKTSQDQLQGLRTQLKEEKENQKKLFQLEKTISESIKKLEENIQNAEIQITQQENQVNLLRENQEQNQTEIAPLQKQLAEKSIERDEQKQQMSFFEENIVKISEELQEIQARLEAADTRPILEKINQVEQQLGKLQGKLGGVESRIESIENQKEERDARITETNNENNTVQMETANLEGEIQVLQEQLSQIDSQLETILENEKQVNEEFKEVRSELNSQKKYHSTLIKDKETVNEKFTKEEEKVTDLKLQRERLAVEVEKLQEEARDNDISFLPAEAEELRDVDDNKITREISRKTEEKTRLEPVNMKALKEFEEENTRFIELLDRRDILIEERQVILDFIEEIETEKYSVFMKVFRSVNRHFGRIFNELSNGDARLILEKDPKKGEDIFEGGILIEAHPAGKKVASLESMSGGEKALTALAFIFAVQTVDAQPFYILDEIDAALDPMNVRRVAKLLHRMSRGVGGDDDDGDGEDTPKRPRQTNGASAQFLVISHRDILMAWADRLYGCTNVKGLSSVFSIQMSEDKRLERDATF
ncbi:MAG: AAA family ATPase [Candidatus Heimdallarchaeota archaeon]